MQGKAQERILLLINGIGVRPYIRPRRQCDFGEKIALHINGLVVNRWNLIDFDTSLGEEKVFGFDGKPTVKSFLESKAFKCKCQNSIQINRHPEGLTITDSHSKHRIVSNPF